MKSSNQNSNTKNKQKSHLINSNYNMNQIKNDKTPEKIRKSFLLDQKLGVYDVLKNPQENLLDSNNINLLNSNMPYFSIVNLNMEIIRENDSKINFVSQNNHISNIGQLKV